MPSLFKLRLPRPRPTSQQLARLEKTNNDVSRYTPLAKEKAVSQQELDNALSAQEAAQAQVAACDARVAKAKLDLAYTRITSPVGRADRNDAEKGR
jgi:membrane fusion protein (multidrug efflux system)